MLEILTTKGKIILAAIVIIVGGMLAYAAYHIYEKETKLQQATVITQQQAQDKNVLQNKLDVSKQNAEILALYIKSAQAGHVQPVNYFTVQAPDLPQATQQVADKINAKDPTLPQKALENTDRTLVVSNIEKNAQTNYDVAVFKVNNYRNWEWSVGYGVQDGNKYIPIGLQRNYSKDKAVEAEVHTDIGKPKNITGYEVKWVVKTDKLFVLF